MPVPGPPVCDSGTGVEVTDELVQAVGVHAEQLSRRWPSPATES